MKILTGDDMIFELIKSNDILKTKIFTECFLDCGMYKMATALESSLYWRSNVPNPLFTENTGIHNELIIKITLSALQVLKFSYL